MNKIDQLTEHQLKVLLFIGAFKKLHDTGIIVFPDGIPFKFSKRAEYICDQFDKVNAYLSYEDNTTLMHICEEMDIMHNGGIR